MVLRVIVVLVLVLSSLWGMDETVFVRVLREAELSAKGASAETAIELTTSLRTQTLLQAVSVASAVVVEVGQYDLGEAYDCSISRGGKVSPPLPRRLFAGVFSVSGPMVPWVMPCRLVEEVGFATLDDGREAFRIADVQPFRVLIAQKEYQDRTIRYHVLFPARFLRDVRVGQKISFEAKLLGLQAYSRNTYNVGVSTTELRTETKMLKCTHGHEYAPSAGYVFCPLDGTKLQ